MNKVGRGLAGLCMIAMLAGMALPALAQSSAVKEKPPMYSYVSDWAIPRAQWGEMEKASTADDAILQKALSSGTLVGYGNDTTIVHQSDGMTHDDWWSSMSMAGLLNVLDQFLKGGNSTTNVLQSATKHEDAVFVSRYYNWKPGTYKGVYTRVGLYKLKSGAPDGAVEMLSKSLVVPLMEKVMSDGAVIEYEVDTQAIHTSSPGMFYIVYITPNADGLDKVNAALQQALTSNPSFGAAFDSMVDMSAHRDELAMTNATYK